MPGWLRAPTEANAAHLAGFSERQLALWWSRPPYTLAVGHDRGRSPRCAPPSHAPENGQRPRSYV